MQTITKTNPNKIIADGKTTPYELLSKDRSDCCGVEALVSVKISDGLPRLLFCGHHFREHESSLPENAEIRDESSKLVFNRLTGPSN